MLRANRTYTEREIWADELLDRLTPAMSAFGILFLLVVLGEQLTVPGSAMSAVLTVLGWVLWAVFVAEFVARMVVAPDTGRFLRRHWWQGLFLVVPFLRILRLVRAVRLLRTGRVLSSAVRGSRWATRCCVGDWGGWRRS
jgi:voltage-gated potassium channel